MLRFIFMAILSSVAAFGTSMIWPRFTSKPMPEILQNIHDTAIKTPIGAKTENILGLSALETPVPINISSVASAVAGTVKTTIEKKTTEIVVNQAVIQLSKQFQTLPAEQQAQIKKIICAP